MFQPIVGTIESSPVYTSPFLCLSMANIDGYRSSNCTPISMHQWSHWHLQTFRRSAVDCRLVVFGSVVVQRIVRNRLDTLNSDIIGNWMSACVEFDGVAQLKSDFGTLEFERLKLLETLYNGNRKIYIYPGTISSSMRIGRMVMPTSTPFRFKKITFGAHDVFNWLANGNKPQPKTETSLPTPSPLNAVSSSKVHFSSLTCSIWNSTVDIILSAAYRELKIAFNLPIKTAVVTWCCIENLKLRSELCMIRKTISLNVWSSDVVITLNGSVSSLKHRINLFWYSTIEPLQSFRLTNMVRKPRYIESVRKWNKPSMIAHSNRWNSFFAIL